MPRKMSVAAEAIDWPMLFADIETRGGVPNASSESMNAVNATFQAMYLDLGAIQQKLATAGLNPPVVVVYADVLNIPSRFSWLLQRSALLIVARRVQAAGYATFNLDYRTSTTASLTLFTSEIAGALNAVTVMPPEGEQPVVFRIDTPPVTGGVHIHLQDGYPTETQLDWSQGLPIQPTEIFQQALRTEFIFGSLLYDQRSALALAMFTWIKSWSGASPDLLATFLRSSSLVALLSAQVNADRNGAAFVPYLTQQVYTDLATAFVEETKQYESDYRSLATEKFITEDGLKLAHTLLDNQTYQSAYVGKLLDQARSNYDNAVAAVDAAQQNFDHAKLQAELTAVDFKDRGIPEWEREQILKAVISLAEAVITFGVGIAGMLVGDEAAGAASAGAAIEGAEAVAQAAKAGSKIAQLAKQLGDVMSKLKEVIEGLQKIYELSKEVIAASNDISHAQSYADKMKQMDVGTGGADLSATYQWQLYQQSADASLADPIAQGVGFANDLKLAIDAVAVYGQALAAAQLAAIKAGQHYAAIQLQKELAAEQQKRLQQYIDELQEGEAPVVAMMQQFYQRYLDAKSSLFAAIEGYRASFFYWALEQSTITPKVIDPVDQIDTGLRNLTAIALDRATALEHFSPPPQKMTGKRFVIEDAAALARLRQEGSTGWVVPLGADAFDGLDRVRLNTVRVWLDGAKAKNATFTVNAMITTSGNYLDRFEGTDFQFTSKPLRRDFQYRVSQYDDGRPDWRFDDGSFGYVEVDGAVDQEVSYAYFEPTPFGEWQIAVKTGSSGADLSGVTRITMEFAGSVIAQTSAARAALIPAREDALVGVGD